MVNVAQSTHEDSVALKSLTRVATIYLPATLIAVSALSRVEIRLESLFIDVLHQTVFSSGLVQLESSGSNDGKGKTHFVIVSEFWIYPVATVILTVLTFIFTLIIDKRRVLNNWVASIKVLIW